MSKFLSLISALIVGAVFLGFAGSEAKATQVNNCGYYATNVPAPQALPTTTPNLQWGTGVTPPSTVTTAKGPAYPTPPGATMNVTIFGVIQQNSGWNTVCQDTNNGVFSSLSQVVSVPSGSWHEIGDVTHGADCTWLDHNVINGSTYTNGTAMNGTCGGMFHYTNKDNKTVNQVMVIYVNGKMWVESYQTGIKE